MASGAVRPVVTLAALYGAGGGIVGSRVAERLGVPFLDRKIPETVAERAGLSHSAVAAVDDGPRAGAGRFVSSLGRASTIVGGDAVSLGQLDLQGRAIRAHIEEFLARARETGGVVLGRGGMVVLQGSPTALHVHLRGDREARLRQAMSIEGIDRATAERRQTSEDDARRSYVRRAYGVDGEDPALYHLVVDSTELSLDACVDLIVAASRARVELATSSAGTG